jgi:hypothetical protein
MVRRPALSFSSGAYKFEAPNRSPHVHRAALNGRAPPLARRHDPSCSRSAVSQAGRNASGRGPRRKRQRGSNPRRQSRVCRGPPARRRMRRQLARRHGGEGVSRHARVFAEFETNLRRERQLEGIAKAKAAGVYKGARAGLTVRPSRACIVRARVRPRLRRRLGFHGCTPIA